MYNHNKAQQSKNRVHISWDILYVCDADSYQVQHPSVKATTHCVKELLATRGPFY